MRKNKYFNMLSEVVEMSESFSLNDLIKSGMNKEQFRAKYAELKESADFSEQFSIFDDEDIEGALDNIFGVADESGDGIIDENDVLKIKQRFNDEKQDEISENDIKMLYQEAMFKQYLNHTPKEMFNIATTGFDDIREVNFVETLDNNISTYEGFIQLRQTSSQARIEKYQDEIDTIVKAAMQKRGIDTKEYENISEISKTLQKQIDNSSNEIEQKERELLRAQKEAKTLEKEIKSLNSASPKDEVEISSRQGQLNELHGKIYGLTTEISALKSSVKTNTDKLKSYNKIKDNFQKELLANEKETAQKIKEIKDKIEEEKKAAQTDVDGYKEYIKIFTNAREYAYRKLTSSPSTSEVSYNFSNRGENVPALKDVNYSAEKGQRLAQDMRNHAVGFIGYCSRHVSNGLERTGLGHERMASAHMMDTELDKNPNFRRITVSSVEELKSLPAGCIVVYEAGAKWDNGFRQGHYNMTHGHIEVTLGNGTACSDGITRNMRYSDRMSVFVPVDG